MRWFGLAALALPSVAIAQPVLFDDFNGSALAPNWVHSPSRWQYNVSGGMLNVTAVTYPNSPESPYNVASMASLLTPLGDFRVDARVGWHGGDLPESLSVMMLTTQGGIVAEMQYRTDHISPASARVVAASFQNFASVAAPAPGMHTFTIARSGGRFSFQLDGNPLANFPDIAFQQPGVILFDFGGPFPGAFGGLHVDWVQVIPNPITLPVVGLSLFLRRRQRRG